MKTLIKQTKSLLMRFVVCGIMAYPLYSFSDEFDGMVKENEAAKVFIITPETVDTINELIRLDGDEYRIFLLKKGEYIVKEAIHIVRSRVAMIGEEGVILKLADGVNQPVLLIGDNKEIPEYMIEEISIQNIEIDGNMDNQTAETGDEQSWIRNNGIDVRRVKGLSISNVVIHHCRSGGFVASWDSEDIYVYNSSFFSNYFDGIALYASKNVIVKDFSSSRNNAAGISLDNKLADTTFINGILEENGDVGIFARDSTSISFINIMIANNRSYGCFLAHQHPGTATGCCRFLFEKCSFIGNQKAGLWLAAPIEDSFENKVSNCIFSQNGGRAIELAPNASLIVENCEFQE